MQNGFDVNTAMGHTAVGLRFNNQINYLNPASYSAQDTLSFIFDFGLTGNITKISSPTSSVTYRNANIGHVALGFPVTRWWGAAIGITPYSKVGYNLVFNGNFESTSTDAYNIIYKGNGGLNRFFIGSGFKIGQHIAVGGNASYIFGSIKKTRTASIVNSSGSIEAGTAETIYSDEIDLKNVMFSFGIQGFTKIGQNSKITGGISLDNKTNLKGSSNMLIYSYYPIISDTIENKISGKIVVPARIGAGFSYSYKEKLLVAFDYINQNWDKSSFFGKKDSVTASSSFRFGVQYTPVSFNEVKRAPYWKHITFRAGGYYNNSYLKINGVQIKDYGMTFGIGIPWKNERNLLTNSSFNISYQLGQRGSYKNGLVKETYQVFSVGFTLFDFWFIKPKYD